MYPETTKGQKYLNNNMRLKTRVGGSSHWQIEKAERHPLNSIRLHDEDKLEIILRNKNLMIFDKGALLGQELFTRQKGFRKKLRRRMIRKDSRANKVSPRKQGRLRRERARIPIGVAMHLAAKHPSWTGETFGETIYAYTIWILR